MLRSLIINLDELKTLKNWNYLKFPWNVVNLTLPTRHIKWSQNIDAWYFLYIKITLKQPQKYQLLTFLQPDTSKLNDATINSSRLWWNLSLSLLIVCYFRSLKVLKETTLSSRKKPLIMMTSYRHCQNKWFTCWFFNSLHYLHQVGVFLDWKWLKIEDVKLLTISAC